MAVNKLRQLDQHSFGVTLPKDELRSEGLVDENGELVDEQHFYVQQTDDGEWTIKRIEQVELA
ncbi:hypothetical protein [Natrarchaeobaculum sulfurireducens]|uniref:DUF8053 domain-containing protein n=1 Tax=Natrarchaeobaculum sulfurireducens TaxID=2044521 RepID=A0A346PDV4_9EURY|nr:hypothetical protein [Natrarchaeobaculum sulfurireducens]AXR77699.1 hypothetical protein AArc1_1364 [Natrarchaeobaculum sulfurireducens]